MLSELGLIIDYPSGILFTNQTGGTACYQSSAEGIHMPLRNDYDPNTLTLYSPEIKLSQYFKHKGCGAIHGIDEEDAMHISNILATYRLQDFIEIDLKKLAESHESWIYVIIQR